MDVGLLLQGWALGLAIAATVGPITLLCVRRTLAEGRAMGLASGMVAFGALFIGLGVTGGDAAGAAILTSGIFLGFASWWVLLVGVVGALRTRLTLTWMRRINVGSGLLIGAFAVVALASALA